MKRIIITIAAALMMGFFAANCNAQAITIEQPKAGEFVAKKNPYNGYTPTNNYYTHTDGVRYEIYTHTPSQGETARGKSCATSASPAKKAMSIGMKLTSNPKN